MPNISPEGFNPGKLHALADALSAVICELRDAQEAFAPFHSAHEGWAVIHEEEQELWDEVRLKTGTPEGRRMEAVQVAAMALRFLIDISADECGGLKDVRG